MTQQSVIGTLRRLADDLETGQWREWSANMTMSRPGLELDAMRGECDLDGFRHFRPGDEVTVTLVIAAPQERDDHASRTKDIEWGPWGDFPRQ